MKILKILCLLLSVIILSGWGYKKFKQTNYVTLSIGFDYQKRSFEFFEIDFEREKYFTPQKLIKELEGSFSVPQASGPIKRLNRLLKKKKLYKLVIENFDVPDSFQNFIKQLEPDNINSWDTADLVRFNRILLEKTFALKTSDSRQQDVCNTRSPISGHPRDGVRHALYVEKFDFDNHDHGQEIIKVLKDEDNVKGVRSKKNGGILLPRGLNEVGINQVLSEAGISFEGVWEQLERMDSGMLCALLEGENDARKLHEKFKKEINQKKKNYLISDRSEQVWTYETLISQIDKIIEEVKSDNSELIFFYFSGHGYSRKENGVPVNYLIPSGARLHGDKHLRVDEVVEKLISTGKHVIIVFDACRVVKDKDYGEGKKPGFTNLEKINMEGIKSKYKGKKDSNEQASILVSSAQLGRSSVDGHFGLALRKRIKYEYSFRDILKAIQEEAKENMDKAIHGEIWYKFYLNGIKIPLTGS